MTDSSTKYQSLIDWMPNSPLATWGDTIVEQINDQLRLERWGDMPTWQRCLERLPEIDPLTTEFKQSVTIGARPDGQRATTSATGDTDGFASVAQRTL